MKDYLFIIVKYEQSTSCIRSLVPCIQIRVTIFLACHVAFGVTIFT